MKILIRSSAIVLLLFFISGSQVKAGTIIGSVNPIPAGTNIDLTLLGESDWVHWGLYTSSSINRKEGVQAQISDFSTFGDLPGSDVPSYQYSDNFNGYT